jgi:hypothetical protein
MMVPTFGGVALGSGDFGLALGGIGISRRRGVLDEQSCASFTPFIRGNEVCALRSQLSDGVSLTERSFHI